MESQYYYFFSFQSSFMKSLKPQIPLKVITNNLINLGKADKVEKLEKHLRELKKKNKTDYRVLAEGIYEGLKQQKELTLHQFTFLFLNISKLMEKNQIKKFQMIAMFNGFKKFFRYRHYLRRQKTKLQFIKSALQEYLTLPHHLSVEFMNFLADICCEVPKYSPYSPHNHALSIVRECQKNLKFTKYFTREKCIALIHYFDLYEEFESSEIVNFLENLNINEVRYVFKNKKGVVMMDLVENYIEFKLPSEMKALRNLLKYIKVDPLQFPSFIKAIVQKAVYYHYKSYSVEFIDLKFSNQPDLLAILTQILLKEKKNNLAIHFINKYRLKQFYTYRQNDKTYQKNPLIEFDRYLPTECIVQGQDPSQYLTLKTFNYQVKNVKTIEKAQDFELAIAEILKVNRIGIDCQWTPMIHGYEKKAISLIQIATLNSVYLFDLLKIGKDKIIKQKFKTLLTNFTGQIIGHTTLKDLNHISIQIWGSQFRNEKATIIDVYHLSHPNKGKVKQKKIKTKVLNKIKRKSIEKVAFQFFKKKLSLFEEYSGWDIRPLRKAQIHYAALDAVVPLHLYQNFKNNSK